MDVFRLQPSEFLTANEIAAAELIHFDEANTQTQLHVTWPDQPVVALALLDQIGRTDVLDGGVLAAIGETVEAWSAGEAHAETLAAAGASLTAAAAQPGLSSADADRLSTLGGILSRVN